MKYLRIDDNNNVYEVSRICWRKDLQNTGARSLVYKDADTKETILKVENYIGQYRIVEDNR